MKQGIILFGHGSRNEAWAQPFHAIQQEIERQQPDTEVRLAFLELMQPSLAEAIGRLVAEGMMHVIVIPVFISVGSHVQEDLPKLIEAARLDHPELKVSVAAALGEAPQMLQAIAHYALTAIPTQH